MRSGAIPRSSAGAGPRARDRVMPAQLRPGHLCLLPTVTIRLRKTGRRFTCRMFRRSCAGLGIRQTWRLLEEQVRRWAAAYDSLYVVTGPELVPGLPRIKGGVGVPRRYFKALLVWHGGALSRDSIPDPEPGAGRRRFRGLCAECERPGAALGYDLFWRLPDSIEERVEGDLDRTFWK